MVGWEAIMKITLLSLPIVGLAAAWTLWWGGWNGGGRLLQSLDPVGDPQIVQATHALLVPETVEIVAPLLSIGDESDERDELVGPASQASAAPEEALLPDSFEEDFFSLPESGSGEPATQLDEGGRVFDAHRKGVARDECIVDGPYTRMHPNGTKAVEGRVRNGKRHGRWSEWYDDGRPRAEGDYYHGEKHGRWTYWYEGGQIHESGEYQYGRRENLWTSWYENGRKEGVGYFRNSRGEGRTTLWYPDGKVAAEGELVDDLREGLWLEWHENGQLASRGTYHYGRIEGLWEFWTDEGVLELGLSGAYERGRRID
jgi:antitoxin component YwqK of YwqJK toxin-antitoxin module